MAVNLGLLAEKPIHNTYRGVVSGRVERAWCCMRWLVSLVLKLKRAPDRMAMILSQGGEFAFVIFTAASAQGILAGDPMVLRLLWATPRPSRHWCFISAKTDSFCPSTQSNRRKRDVFGCSSSTATRVIIAGMVVSVRSMVVWCMPAEFVSPDFFGKVLQPNSHP